LGEMARTSARVLVVDDEPIVRKTARAGLERAGFAIEEAPCGRDALRLVHEWKPELMVLDAMLPDIHGLDVLKQVRQAGLALPVIVMSAFYQGPGYAEDIKQSFGATAFVEK